MQWLATIRANFEKVLNIKRWMASKVQVAREFVPANATFMKLVGDLSTSFTSTFENQRDLDPAACDGVCVILSKKLNNSFTGFKITLFNLLA